MATQDVGAPTPREAQETLRRLADDENAVRYPPIPAWFFAVQAAAVAGLHLVRMLPDSDAGRLTQLVAILAMALATGGLGSTFWLNRTGVAWTSSRFRDMAPFLVGVVGTYAASWVLAEVTGAAWVWLVGAAVAGTVVLVTGARYRREFG